MDIAKAEDGRHIMYATKGKINRVGTVLVNSLVTRGSGLNTNSNVSLAQQDTTVKRKDLEYLFAVNQKNMKTAQRMVDQTAVDAGAILDEDGKAIPLSERFNESKNDLRYKTAAEDAGDKAASGQKKPSNSTASPLTRRPGNQGSFSSARVNTSFAATAELLNINNINDLSDSVKRVISDLGAFYESVDKQIPVLGFKRTITGSNLEGSLVSRGILKREGSGISAYRYDNGHGLRISNHSANAENFVGSGEHLSLALFERGKNGARPHFP